MISKQVKYTDILTGEEREETLFFHLNKAEAVRIMARAKTDDFEKYVRDVVASEDTDAIFDLFESVIKMAYGSRSTEDGRTFIKNKAEQEAFLNSEAYSELFVELITNADEADQFMRGVVGGVADNKPNLKVVKGEEKPTKEDEAE